MVADLQITDLVEQVEGADAGVVADPAPPHAEERREADPHAPADAVAEQHPVEGDLEPGRQECQQHAQREPQSPHRGVIPSSRPTGKATGPDSSSGKPHRLAAARSGPALAHQAPGRGDNQEQHQF